MATTPEQRVLKAFLRKQALSVGEASQFLQRAVPELRQIQFKLKAYPSISHQVEQVAQTIQAQIGILSKLEQQIP